MSKLGGSTSGRTVRRDGSGGALRSVGRPASCWSPPSSALTRPKKRVKRWNSSTAAGGVRASPESAASRSAGCVRTKPSSSAPFCGSIGPAAGGPLTSRGGGASGGSSDSPQTSRKVGSANSVRSTRICSTTSAAGRMASSSAFCAAVSPARAVAPAREPIASRSRWMARSRSPKWPTSARSSGNENHSG